MEKTRLDLRGSDAIDRFTTDILRHPERADALKARLRQSLGVAAANGAGRGTSSPRRTTVTSDFEDFWDNVPV